MKLRRRGQARDVAIAAFISLLFAAPLRAQDALYEAYKHCNDQSRPAESRISECLRAINAQGLEPFETAYADVNLASVYSLKGDDDQALGYLNNAVKQDPSIWVAYADRAVIYLKRLELESALSDYQSLVSLDANNLTLHMRDIGDYRLHDNTTGQAVAVATEEYKRLRDQLKTSLTDNFRRRCVAELQNNALDRALADCNSALGVDGGNEQSLIARAFVFARRGDTASGRKDLDLAVQNDPKSAVPLYFRAKLERATGDARAANSDLAAAQAIDPQITQRFQSGTQ